MRGFFIPFFLFVSAGFSLAQVGYRIEVKVKGWKDTTAYLGYSFWDQTAIKDTARVNNQGSFAFDNSKPLPQGVYYLVLSQSRIFDFVVSADQQFILETSDEDYVRNMTVTGDEDNKLFFEYQVFNVERHKEVEPFIKVLKDSTLSKDDTRRKTAQESFSKVSQASTLKYLDHLRRLMDRLIPPFNSNTIKSTSLTILIWPMKPCCAYQRFFIKKK
jgi:hypothetical protein